MPPGGSTPPGCWCRHSRPARCTHRDRCVDVRGGTVVGVVEGMGCSNGWQGAASRHNRLTCVHAGPTPCCSYRRAQAPLPSLQPAQHQHLKNGGALSAWPMLFSTALQPPYRAPPSPTPTQPTAQHLKNGSALSAWPMPISTAPASRYRSAKLSTGSCLDVVGWVKGTGQHPTAHFRQAQPQALLVHQNLQGLVEGSPRALIKDLNQKASPAGPG